MTRLIGGQLLGSDTLTVNDNPSPHITANYYRLTDSIGP
jgi:hypothetical protein